MSQEGNITAVPNNSLPSDLVEIYFYDNPISNITSDAFNSSANTLTSVYFRNLAFKNIPEALLSLTNLTTLSMSGMGLVDWDNVVLKHIATTIKELVLREVNLTSFPGWLSTFRSLDKLDLSGNPLHSIPDDAFFQLEGRLRSLYLDNTGLVKVPEALSKLKNLLHLHMNDNNITDLQGVPRVEMLSVAGNSVSDSEILVNVFSPYTDALMTLNLESNKLTAIPNLSRMTKLMEVYLGWNDISDPTGSFSPSVTILKLQGNNLTSIPTDIANISGLSVLDVSHNCISEITYDNFPANLTELNLQGNTITEITEESFSNLSNLMSLHLDSNPISKISQTAFKDLQFLRYLNLGGSRLPEVPVAITSLKGLTYLNLSNIPTLNCPCPVAKELVDWYNLESGSSLTSSLCNDGRDLRAYLSGNSCQASTQPPSPQTTAKGNGGSAPELLCAKKYIYALFFLSLVFAVYV